MKSKTDEDLVLAVCQGNISAFEELVKRYQRKLYSFALHIVRDEPMAQDVVQDALFRAYTSIDHVDTTKKFSSYLFTIAKNTAISFMRKRKYTVSLGAVAEQINEDKTMYEHLIDAEQHHYIKQVIGKLEEKYRRVISLYYFDDLSYEEISKKLKIPINTVRTRLSRAKGAFRKIYEAL